MSEQSIAAEIAELEKLLSAGVTSVSSDGETLQLDIDGIRNRLEVLNSQLAGAAHKARRVRTLGLGSAF